MSEAAVAARAASTALVAGQVALACTLLVSSALLVRTVTRMVNTPTGVDADDVVTAGVQLTAPTAGFLSDPQWRTFADQHGTILEHTPSARRVIGWCDECPAAPDWLAHAARSKAMRRVGRRSFDRQCQTVSEATSSQ